MSERLLAFVLIAATAGLCTSSGCGSGGPQMVPISGSVSFEGKPLAVGTVEYIPQDPGGRKAIGRIQSDGSYELTTFKDGDGAMVGKYAVVVVALAKHPGEPTPEQLRASGGVVKRGSLIPEKYGDISTSGLSDTVDDDHSGTFDINLRS